MCIITASWAAVRSDLGPSKNGSDSPSTAALPRSADIVKHDPTPLDAGRVLHQRCWMRLKRPAQVLDRRRHGQCPRSLRSPKVLCRSPSTRALVRHRSSLDALVYARGLRFGDSFQLAFSSQIRFELGEYPEHVEKCFTCCRRCIYGLFCCFEAPSLGPDGSNQGLPKGLGRDGLYMLPCSITNSRCSL